MPISGSGGPALVQVVYKQTIAIVTVTLLRNNVNAIVTVTSLRNNVDGGLVDSKHYPNFLVYFVKT